MADAPAPTMDQTFGVMFIGVLFATFFQGILTVQSYIFFEAFPQDLLRLKLLVASIWLLDVTHLVLIAQSAYHYLVTNYNNPAALAVATASLDLHLIFIGAPTLLCQGFFVHRIWLFSKHNILLVSLLSAACLAAFGLELAISGQIIQVPSVAYFSVLKGEVVAVFALGAAVDVAIALVLLFYLQQGRMKNYFNSTSWILGRVMDYTVATGLATSLLAVACLIAYMVMPHTFIFIAMHFSLGRLYTNALLATLNSRRSLRNAASGSRPAVPSFTIMTSRVITTKIDDPVSPSDYALKELTSPMTASPTPTPLRPSFSRARARADSLLQPGSPLDEMPVLRLGAAF